MLITKEIEILLTGKKISHYENKGYQIPREKDKWRRLKVKEGTKLKVNVFDLPDGSGEYVEVLCDYCQKEIVRKQWRKYISQHKNNSEEKDCCNNCVHFKIQDTFKQKYGVKSPSQISGINERISNSLKHDFNYIENIYKNKSCVLLSGEDEYKNNTSILKFRCNKHNTIIQQSSYQSFVSAKYGCYLCSIENRSGENHYYWNGGISPLHNYMRDKIVQWRADSLKYNNYKCYLTGEKGNIIVHHLYGFKQILEESLQELNLDLHDTINQYTEDELNLLTQKIIDKHYKYGYGVILISPIHDLFHNIYLRGNNTPEQFEEFKQRYYNFEFDDLLEEKYKYKNILKEVD